MKERNEVSDRLEKLEYKNGKKTFFFSRQTNIKERKIGKDRNNYVIGKWTPFYYCGAFKFVFLNEFFWLKGKN